MKSVNDSDWGTDCLNPYGTADNIAGKTFHIGYIAKSAVADHTSSSPCIVKEQNVSPYMYIEISFTLVQRNTYTLFHATYSYVQIKFAK